MGSAKVPRRVLRAAVRGGRHVADLVAGDGRDVLQVDRAPGAELHGDEVVDVGDVNVLVAHSCGLGARPQRRVVDGDEILQDVQDAQVGREAEVGSAGQCLGIARIEVEQVGVDAAQVGVDRPERCGQAVVVQTGRLGDDVEVERRPPRAVPDRGDAAHHDVVDVVVVEDPGQLLGAKRPGLGPSAGSICGEGLQYFSPTRVSKIEDIFYNLIGIALATALFFIFKKTFSPEALRRDESYMKN